MASRGTDHSSTQTTDCRLNGELFDFTSVPTSGVDSNEGDTPVLMHDACNDNGCRFRTDVSRLAGILKQVNYCNDYDSTLYRWNTNIYVVCITGRPVIQR